MQAPLVAPGLEIHGTEVHLWRKDMDAGDDRPGLEALLCPGEMERARRFKFEKDARHFMAAHAFLHEVLGGYLGADPGSLLFARTAAGKPYLAGAWSRSPIRFNLSHSGGACLLAVAKGREVGCDLERIRADVFLLEMALQFFSAKEKEWLKSLPREEALENSYRLWTFKESFLKATGDGLFLGLDTFSVIPGAENGAALDAPGQGRGWICREIEGLPGFRAAVCVENNGVEGLTLRRFDR